MCHATFASSFNEHCSTNTFVSTSRNSCSQMKRNHNFNMRKEKKKLNYHALCIKACTHLKRLTWNFSSVVWFADSVPNALYLFDIVIVVQTIHRFVEYGNDASRMRPKAWCSLFIAEPNDWKRKTKNAKERWMREPTPKANANQCKYTESKI